MNVKSLTGQLATGFLATGLLGSISFSGFATEQPPSLWQDVPLVNKNESQYLTTVAKVNVMAQHYRLVDGDIEQLSRQLMTSNQAHYDVLLPMPDGTSATFRLQYDPIYQAGFEQKYPEIRTFKGYQLDQPDNRGRFDITPHGFHGMFSYQSEPVFIDPLQRGNNQRYISYFRKDAVPLSRPGVDKVLPSFSQWSMMANDLLDSGTVNGQKNPAIIGDQHRTYRIAVAAAGEYTEFHGGTKLLSQAAIVTAINRVNEVYKVDFAVTLQLIANNDVVVFTDANTDPFANSDEDIDTNITVMADLIGNDNFDIGHIVNTSGGGLAGFGVVCQGDKAAGITGSPQPTGDPFVIDFIAHEIGHQFGGAHSFNGLSDSCVNRSGSDAYEPGSGSTIMAYAGICSEENLQNNSDPFFHAHSIDQMGQFIVQGATCGTPSAITNQPPVANAGADFTIPVNTPFILSGSATDADGDSLSYIFEQFDLGAASNGRAEMVDDGSRPIFRSWTPSANSSRYLPRLSDVLNGTSTTIGEAYPTTNRDLNFRLTVRDGQGNLGSDDVKVTVSTVAGPFAVTSPSGSDTWNFNSNPLVTWDVANTQLAPVSCSDVDILLSIDGGLTFDRTLLSGTTNDGSQGITVPTLDSTTARVMVKCQTSGFFNVSGGGDFTINGSVPTNGVPTITGQLPLSVAEDNALTVEFGDLIVVDSDNNYPSGFSMTLTAGSNYTVNGQTIIPDANFFGTLTVPVIVNDGTIDSASFNLTVTVDPVNDAPLLTAVSQQNINENQSLTISLAMLTVSDIDNTNSELSVLVASGNNYTVSGSTITPVNQFNGTLTVGIRVSDGNAQSESVNMLVAVAGLNDAPMINGAQAVSVLEDNAVTLTIDLLNITDLDNSPAQMTMTAMAGTNYTVQGLTITPAANFFGQLAVPVKVNDGQLDSNTFNLTVNVTAVNDPPLITATLDQTINENGSLTITTSQLTIVDIDNSINDMILTVLPGDHYQLSNGNELIPDIEFNGVIQVPVQVNDGQLDSNIASLLVTVTPVNNTPVIVSVVAISMAEDQSLALSLNMLVASDPDSSELTLVVLPGINYSVDGQTITPVANFFGELLVNIAVSDGNSTSAEKQMSVNVEPVNDLPIANNDSFTFSQGSSNNALAVLLNDTDIDGDTLNLESFSYTGTGTLSQQNNNLVYTPAASFAGSETLSYVVTDNQGGTAIGTVTITVTASNTGNGGGSSTGGGGGGGSMPLVMLGLLALAVVRRRLPWQAS